ncbi:homoserine kinase [Andreesenia angusta]|uniref:Homoserine kinase n=1 Tax=Andreesenia angusta TaxID=39480 RepID=A0A1S1V576_9FIRM|nr:homoserine kinase [Andreesenia angusta]OHW61550.1 homoserine kinase [Andreesenia angusta]
MIEVIVPATSANLGPGFDCMGLALNLYNKFTFQELESGIIVEGTEKSFEDEDNLIYIAMKKCFEKIGYEPSGIKITSETDVPVSRGLGSSATCIVAGIIGANEMTGRKLSRQEILELATELEGHPDNIAPALLGGCVTSVYEDGKVYSSKVRVKHGLKFYALIPNFKLSTQKARGILPKVVSFEDAVYNVGRVALMTSALANGEFEMLRVAGKDRLHQQYRGGLIDGYDSIIEESENAGAYGAFLSGAGPTILIAVDVNDRSVYTKLRSHVNNLKYYWDIKELHLDKRGAIVKTY